MKLLTATSFFLLLLILIFSNACQPIEEIENKNISEIRSLELKAKEYRKKGMYDSAIFCQEKALKIAYATNDNSSLQEGFFGQYLNYKKKSEKDSMLFYLQKGSNISAVLKDTLWMAKAEKRQGEIYYEQDEFENAFSKCVSAKKKFLKINDTVSAGKVLLDIAKIQKKQGGFGASELSALEGLKYLEHTNELRSLAGLYHVLSVASKETGRFKIAEKRINQALALAKDPESIKKIKKDNINIFRNTKANIFKESGQYDKAISIYEYLQEQQKNDTLEIKRVNANLAHTLFLQNGYNMKSDSLLLDAESYFSLKQNLSGIFSTQLKLAQIYSDVNLSKSLFYIDKALISAKKLNNPKSIYETLEIKINIKYIKEDFNKYVTLGKQIEAEEENLNYLYANERFDYEQSEKDKEKAKQRELKASEAAARNRVSTLILLLILIVVLVLTYFIYQKITRRHKIEKVKTVHKTEARISTKVHDELANDIHNLMAQLETSSPDKDIVLDKLDTIYNNARDISKQNRSVETGEGFPDELNNLFRSYRSDEVNVLLKRYNVEIWNGISTHVKTTVYRVLQELLTNMKKHSNAALVVVSIEKKNKQLFIQYIDNGKGFTEEISKNGLQNAENRIHAIKGKLTFDTELNKGCKFSINVPV